MFLALILTLTFANAPYVHDGDTLYYNKTGLRLEGIDAPELPTVEGMASRDGLKGFLKDKDLVCEYVDTDMYKRLVVACKANGEDVSEWMVKERLACAYSHYSHKYDEIANCWRN